MDQSKKVANNWSYLWPSLALNVLVGLIGTLLSMVIFFPVFFLIMTFIGESTANMILESLTADSLDLSIMPYSALAVFLFIIVTYYIITFFVSKREFPRRYKKFAEQYENADVSRFFHFTIGWMIGFLALDFIISLTYYSGINSQLSSLAFSLSFLAVGYYGFMAGMKKI